jgi:hypothetical protein
MFELKGKTSEAYRWPKKLLAVRDGIFGKTVFFGLEDDACNIV